MSKFIPTFIEPGRLFTQMSVVSICKIHKFIKKEKAVQFYRFVPHLKGFHRVAHSKFSSSSLPPPPPLSNHLSVTGISLPWQPSFVIHSTFICYYLWAIALICRSVREQVGPTLLALSCALNHYSGFTVIIPITVVSS